MNTPLKNKIPDKLRPFQSYLALGAGIFCLLVMVAFAESRHQSKRVNAVNISISADQGHKFIKEADVHYIIRNRISPQLEDKPFSRINLAEMEKVFKENPYIKEAEVYHDVKGTITIEIAQRNPVLRIFNQEGNSFYLDESGDKMPLSLQYTAPVITATGHIDASLDSPDSVDSITVRSLHKLVNYIRTDSFLTALAGQLKVNKDREFQIIPRVGEQTIIFGKAEHLEKRFSKLKAFYRKVLPDKGWYIYDTINLKFRKQIVAKK